MLYKESVSSDTLELLTTLMHDPLLCDFFLVGGTALSLQIGHRQSIDLDLFTTKDFDESALLEDIESKYGFYTDFQSKNTLKGQIGGVKVDFISHKYSLIDPLLIIEDVRMAGMDNNYSWSVIERRLNDMLHTPEQLFGPINMSVKNHR